MTARPLSRPRPPSRRACRHGRQRGLAVVEFALTATLVVTIALGASEYGRAMYQYDTLAKNVRAAARYLGRFAGGDATAIGQAKCLAVSGTTDCSGGALVPGLVTGMVSVCDSVSCPGTHARQTTGFGVINLVTVTITGATFKSLATGFVPDFGFGTLQATMPQE